MLISGGETSSWHMLRRHRDATDYPLRLRPPQEGVSQSEHSLGGTNWGQRCCCGPATSPPHCSPAEKLSFTKKRALAIYLPLAASQTGTARLYAFIVMRTTFVWYNGLVGDWRDGMEERKFNPLHFRVKDNWSTFFLGWRKVISYVVKFRNRFHFQCNRYLQNIYVKSHMETTADTRMSVTHTVSSKFKLQKLKEYAV